MNHFDWKQYIDNYPDLKGFKKITAWKHWNFHGKSENRTDIKKEDELTVYLNKLNFKYQGGNVQQTDIQISKLLEILTEIKPLKIMEIGFNAGHSSEIFLKNTNADVVSFDIVSDAFPYTMYGKRYLDTLYPNRHILIKGNSTITVPQYNDLFDIIFIDGCHDYNVVKLDLENCKRLAHENTIVIIDDTIYKNDWVMDYSIGPTKAWLEQIEQNKIEQIDYIDIIKGKGMSWGKYNLNKIMQVNK
jgi:predicted O-methyltransferase YrrM